MKNWLMKLWYEYRGFTLFVILMVIFRTALADWNTVPTGSMKPTILEGDRILVNKLAYDLRVPLTHVSIFRIADPKRGDIVVFRYPRDTSKSYIKRVIGVAGDHIRIDNGQVYVNGEAVEEDYVPSDYADSRSYPEITVPRNTFFVLGDHRTMSNDSRDFGPVNERFIYGKAVFGYWPMEKMGRLR